jgi:hypothetical protein
VLEPVQEQRAVRQACQRVVQSAMARLLLAGRALDGGAEDVRDRVGEADRVRREAARLAGVRRQHAPGALRALDRHRDGALRAELRDERVALEAVLDAPVLDHDRPAALERLDQVARRQGRRGRDGVHAGRDARRRAMAEALARHELEHAGDLRREHLVHRRHALCHQILDRGAFQRHLAEPGDRLLLRGRAALAADVLELAHSVGHLAVLVAHQRQAHADPDGLAVGTHEPPLDAVALDLTAHEQLPACEVDLVLGVDQLVDRHRPQLVLGVAQQRAERGVDLDQPRRVAEGEERAADRRAQERRPGPLARRAQIGLGAPALGHVLGHSCHDGAVLLRLAQRQGPVVDPADRAVRPDDPVLDVVAAQVALEGLDHALAIVRMDGVDERRRVAEERVQRAAPDLLVGAAGVVELAAVRILDPEDGAYVLGDVAEALLGLLEAARHLERLGDVDERADHQARRLLRDLDTRMREPDDPAVARDHAEAADAGSGAREHDGEDGVAVVRVEQRREQRRVLDVVLRGVAEQLLGLRTDVAHAGAVEVGHVRDDRQPRYECRVPA